ncbi:hypothetical protein XBP1_1760003 [Xenorhabdus bovienii str. puntauvense]|uniref:Uncharacterized protein n=1 Tax=Xenorhabdus bovienii str. puntauvense TaxID=1398201 RepID=A0A077NCA3_XENBV|nr:hypothetical protein [Xenorhabdus bovienii]CDG95933.1 hypothetical protein XBP1_1760003 [Xenorhabdus bovienii str. puntauvense]
MKSLTSLERSKLQLTMMSRLYDVFGDVQSDVEITPEYIQETLVQFMQMATGDNYHIAKSVRIGFGELQQLSECAGRTKNWRHNNDKVTKNAKTSTNTRGIK